MLFVFILALEVVAGDQMAQAAMVQAEEEVAVGVVGAQAVEAEAVEGAVVAVHQGDLSHRVQGAMEGIPEAEAGVAPV